MLSGKLHIWVSDFVAAERTRAFLVPLGVRVEIAVAAHSVLVSGENTPPDLDIDALKRLDGVREVAWTKPPMATMHTVEVGDVVFGAGQPVVIAGPCAVESRARLVTIARAVKAAGASMLRGGAFKPRTSPKSFQGLGEAGLKILREVGLDSGLPVVTEVPSPDVVALYCEYADMLQIGSRHMQNTPLLKAVGKTNRPVLLKRSATATLDEWVAAADYIRDGGNERIVLCERGIRTFDTDTRYTLDLAAFIVVAEQTGLPVIADPSHAAGNSRWVAPLAKAALAAGAAGLMIEVHDDPASALSDGAQALTPEAFAQLIRELRVPVPRARMIQV
jgi:3-deoxy-7-phosphoheptulonate synthase